jgi:hypothetical protein
MQLETKPMLLTVNGTVSPCYCKCAHCLLCSGDNKINKVSFLKLQELALKFKDLKVSHDIFACLSVYNSAEYPELSQEIETNRILSFPFYHYLNVNGTKIRTGIELDNWVSMLKKSGVVNCNLSWFGLKSFHDWFVNKQGYFDYLTELLKTLETKGINRGNSIFLFKSNLAQLDELTEKLHENDGKNFYCLSDYRGNGKHILDEFITENDYLKLPGFIKETINRSKYCPEYEWMEKLSQGDYPKFTQSTLQLVATPETIDHYLEMSVDEILDVFNGIDTKLKLSIPSLEFLAEQYGDSKSTILFDFRSMIWKWTDMHFEANQSLDKSILFSDLRTSVKWG